MHLLVIRISSMGDVALATPVFAAILEQYPKVRITLVTQPAFIPLFHGMPDLGIFPVDFRNRHKGFAGIIRLYRDLRKVGEIDHVIDLHDVIRSKLLRWLFRLSGVAASVINKGRAEKRALITGKNKVQLKHAVERYFDVFTKAGFPAKSTDGHFIQPSHEALQKISLLPGIMNTGIAPYAKHALKIWPEDYLIRLLEMISRKTETKFWLFGGREDIEKLKALANRVPGSEIVAGQHTLSEELALMSKLDLMITMDSANMHLAALAGTKVISIWGCTDPLAGFGAWDQPDDYSIRIPVDELTCRPCSVYGKGKTHNSFKCMKTMTPELVYEKLVRLNIIK